MEKYAQFGGGPDAFAWRFTSGVLHAQEWASLMGEIEEVRPGATLRELKATANQRTAINMTTAATRHFEAAVADYESYLKPATA